MNAFPCFLTKCFTVNSLGPKSSATSPFPRLDSHFPLVLRCIRDLSVSIYVSLFLLPLLSQAFTALVLPSFSLLSQFLSSFPSRFLPVEPTTVSPSGFPPFHSPFCHLDQYTYVDPRTKLYHLFISTTERKEEYNGSGHQCERQDMFEPKDP